MKCPLFCLYVSPIQLTETRILIILPSQKITPPKRSWTRGERTIRGKGRPFKGWFTPETPLVTTTMESVTFEIPSNRVRHPGLHLSRLWELVRSQEPRESKPGGRRHLSLLGFKWKGKTNYTRLRETSNVGVLRRTLFYSLLLLYGFHR